MFDFVQLAECLFAKADVSDGEISLIVRIAYKFGRVPFSSVLIGIVYLFFRGINGKIILKQTTKKTVWHCFSGYWFCSYILGFKKISLVRVPIPVQYKVLCAGLFEDYLAPSITEKVEDKVSVSSIDGDIDKFTSTINLVLADTYGIDVEKQLPQSVSKLTTVVIDRSSNDHTRYYSQKFVSEVISRVRALPNKVHTINIFATTNPMHNLRIAQDVFMTGGRDSIEHLFVYQQSMSEGRPFEGKKLKIY